MKSCTFYTILFFLCISVIGLRSQSYLTVRGIVLDQSTQAPVPFAHIGMPEHGIGTVTSEQGAFSFNFPEQLKNASIEISHIGHFTIQKTYSDWPNPDSALILLSSQAVQLEGVEVLESEYPLSYYVNKAIKNLNRNYPSKLHLMSGFFREAKVNTETMRYDRLVEAAVDIQDKGLKSNPDNVRIHIRELRKSDDFSAYSQLNEQLNERFGDRNKMYDLFLRNPIRSYQNETSPLSLQYNPLELMKNREDKLKLRAVTYIDNTKIYIIDYEDVLFSGTLYLDSEDYGLHRLEFYTDLNFKRPEQSKEGTLNKIDRSQKAGIHKDIYLYQKVQDIYHLSLIQKTSFDDFLNNQEGSNDKVSSYAIRTLLINDFYTNRKAFDRIKWKEQEKKDIPIYDINMPYNKNFWETYNMIQLEPLNQQIQNDLEWTENLEAQFRKNGEIKKK